MFDGTIELGVAIAFIGNVAAAFEIAFGTGVTGPRYRESDVLTPAIVFEDGHLTRPAGPGISAKARP